MEDPQATTQPLLRNAKWKFVPEAIAMASLIPVTGEATGIPGD